MEFQQFSYPATSNSDLKFFLAQEITRKYLYIRAKLWFSQILNNNYYLSSPNIQWSAHTILKYCYFWARFWVVFLFWVW